MALWCAAVLLAMYLLVSAETYLATHARGLFRMSVLGFGPTELRIVLAAGAVRAAYDPYASFGSLGSVPLFDLGAKVYQVVAGCHPVDKFALIWWQSLVLGAEASHELRTEDYHFGTVLSTSPSE